MTNPFSKDYQSQLGDFIKKASQDKQKSSRATKTLSRLREEDPNACKIPVHPKGKAWKGSSK
jgi:hypothetical protein